MRIIFSILTLFLLFGCSNNNMKPTGFKDQKPRLIIEEYLTGNVKAYGILQNRSGKVTRQFTADLDGKWESVMGYKPSELKGTRYDGESLIHPEDLKSVKKIEQNLNARRPSCAIVVWSWCKS